MEITHLDKNVLFGAFAKACSNFDGGIVGGGNCFADDIGIGCPFESDSEEMSCCGIKPAHWREVFEGKDKPEHEFQFGDKVTVTLCDGKKRKAFCHTVGGDGIAYFYEGFPHTLFARWEDIREGWE